MENNPEQSQNNVAPTREVLYGTLKFLLGSVYNNHTANFSRFLRKFPIDFTNYEPVGIKIVSGEDWPNRAVILCRRRDEQIDELEPNIVEVEVDPPFGISEISMLSGSEEYLLTLSPLVEGKINVVERHAIQCPSDVGFNTIIIKKVEEGDDAMRW